MSLEDLGNIGEFVAAVAVVVSLIYLAVQIRQSTGTARANSVQDLTENLMKGLETLLEPERAELYLRGARSYSELNPEEKLRFQQIVGLLVSRFDTVLEYKRLRLIGTSYLEPHAENMRVIFSHPGILEWWEGHERLFTQQVREWVAKNVASRERSAGDSP